MKRVLNLIVLVFLINSIVSAQEKTHICSDSKIKYFSSLEKFQNVQYPGDENIDVTYYKLDIAIDYASQNISGDITISAKSLISGMISFTLDLQNALTINSINTGGSNLAFSHDNNLINITLDKTYNLDEEFTVIVNYSGTPGSSGFGSFEFSSHNGVPAIWTLSEPYGASDWWPCKDTPADKADSVDVWITVDDEFKAVSNGTLEEIVDNGATLTYKWHSKYPIAQYLISLAITNYDLYENIFNYKNESMTLYHYIYPENLNSSTIIQLDRTVDMLEIFSDAYGIYPFIDEKYGHAQFGWGGGMEHQTISSMGSFGEGLVAHELAHQWFGDKITCKDWHHIWLNEGFATYSEAVFQEAAYGKAEYDSEIASDMNRAKYAIGSIYVQDISSVNEIFNSARSYSKGGLVLHMLRGIVGKDIFFDILKTYVADSTLAYGVAVTEDFQRVAEEVSGIDLGYFFSEWIYGENYPKYRVGWNYTDAGDGTFDVKVRITQSVNSSPSFFTMPIELEFEILGDVETFTVMNNKEEQVFNFKLSSEPLSFSFDPGNWILKDVLEITEVNNEDAIIYDFALEQNYPNPFNPSTTIRYSVPSTRVNSVQSIIVKIKVYDLLGREIATLVSKEQEPGNYEVKFDASSLSSGVYFYKLQVADFVDTKKMLLLL